LKRAKVFYATVTKGFLCAVVRALVKLAKLLFRQHTHTWHSCTYMHTVELPIAIQNFCCDDIWVCCSPK